MLMQLRKYICFFIGAVLYSILLVFCMEHTEKNSKEWADDIYRKRVFFEILTFELHFSLDSSEGRKTIPFSETALPKNRDFSYKKIYHRDRIYVFALEPNPKFSRSKNGLDVYLGIEVDENNCVKKRLSAVYEQNTDTFIFPSLLLHYSSPHSPASPYIDVFLPKKESESSQQIEKKQNK